VPFSVSAYSPPHCSEECTYIRQKRFLPKMKRKNQVIISGKLRISNMSGLLSVLVVLAVVFVIRKLWRYLSATAQNAPRRTEDAEAVIATRETVIRKAIRNGYRSGKNIESPLFPVLVSFGKLCNSRMSHNSWNFDIHLL
jgi:hypothetical protein